MGKDKEIQLIIPENQEVILIYKRSEKCKNPWGEGDAFKIFTDKGWFITTSRMLISKFISLNIYPGVRFSLTKIKGRGYTKYLVKRL